MASIVDISMDATTDFAATASIDGKFIALLRDGSKSSPPFHQVMIHSVHSRVVRV